MKKFAITFLGTILPVLMLSAQSYSIDGNTVRIYSSEVSDTVRMVVTSDTHLSISDSREDPYREYSKRMAGAYLKTRHFITGAETNPQEALKETLEHARKIKADGMALLGDLFNFPSEAAVDWFMDVMGNSGVSFYYTTGNHDWHYEGMPGSLKDLRSTWTEKRLMPLFQGENPLCYAKEIKGVRFLLIDNSIYEILPEQLEFLEKEIKTGKPLVLMMHIPLYVEGRKTDYGCGSPYWGAAIDDSFELERRERWPESGHTEVTMKFHEMALSAPNIMGVFAGHSHSKAIDIVNGTPQFVMGSNARACYMDLLIIPSE